MTCTNKVDLGQSGYAICGTKWGDSEILCDKCKSRCKNCKHWSSESCFLTDLQGDFGYCDKHSPERGDDTKDNLAIAICFGEGIEDKLLTKPDFGCIEFEVK